MGFGLGPTLEAYSLISKELQKNGLELWRNDKIFETNKGTRISVIRRIMTFFINCLDKDTPMAEYIDVRYGLYPAPLGRNAKANLVTKIRQKFKFLGKFMAKALMDSRMVIDLIFHSHLLLSL